MKKRFWFEEVKKVEEANFVWTQLKEENVFKMQNVKSIELAEQIQSLSKIGSKQYIYRSATSINDSGLA